MIPVIPMLNPQGPPPPSPHAPRRPSRERPRALVAAVAVVAFAIWVGAASVSWFMWSLSRDLPNRETLRSIGDMAQSTTLFDAQDRPAFTVYKEQRIEVPLQRISPHLVRALVSMEDQRFYEHRGVDMVRVLGAGVANLRQGRRAQGGSTITQQLARQSLVSVEKTFARKFKEVLVAAQLERTYTKQEILELYFNKVYFGDGLYGAEAASLGYFGKHASELSIDQAALLAGLVKSPSTYAPTVNPERATARRNLVLQAMVDAGAITKVQGEQARAAKLELHDGLRQDEPHGLYFKEQVRQALVERFGWERVYRGGLKVYTTVDLDMQKAAELQVARSLEEIETRRAQAEEQRLRRVKGRPAPTPEHPPLQAALVAMDPLTGHVRAMVGGRDFEESHFNRAMQARRQPGSAFKPFVFAAAMEAGYTPASLIDHLDQPVMALQGEWMPEDEHLEAGAMTLRTALRTSSNRAAVRLLQDVGIGKTVSSAKALGVGSMPNVPSLALGSGEVTLMAMTAAYAAFANKGMLPQPTLIRRVEDLEGQVLFESKEEATRAVSETTAFLLVSMLADVVNQGTGYRARQVGFTLPAGGKTGTTNDYRDAWFVGFTPSLATGVWIGFDQPETILANGYAGDLAVPLWARFMRDATKGDKPVWFTLPKNVVGVHVCRLSGKLPNEGCNAVEILTGSGEVQTRSMVYTDYFVRGKQPTEVCPLHEVHGFFDRVAGMFGKDGEQPVSAEAVGLPSSDPAARPTTGVVAGGTVPDGQRAVGPEEPKKKRGFWSKVFGRGQDRDDRDKDNKNEPHR
jgi:1A family penicillin-binding protein